MSEIIHQFDRETLGRAEQLALKSRRIVEGLRAGHHRSPFHGSSVEFAEHKEYAPGDPLKNMDWKLFGKSDKYYVKRYEEETNLQAWILLDTSASMGFGRQEVPKLPLSSWWERLRGIKPSVAPEEERLPSTRLEYATLLAASLATLLVTQGDAVGLVTFGSEGSTLLPPRSRGTHLSTLMATLSQTESRGQGFIAQALRDFAPRVTRRSMVILISDLLEDTPEVLESLKGLRTRRNDVLLAQLLHKDELEFPYDDVSRFEDPEDRASFLIADPREMKDGYLKELQAWLELIRQGSFEAQVEHRLINTQTPVVEALAALSADRQGGRRR